MAVFFARIVMPRSRSSSLESITRSTWVSLARKVPLWFSMASTSVVFPWSTCAMMAILRRLLLKTTVLPVGGNRVRQGKRRASESVLSVYNTRVNTVRHGGTENTERGEKEMNECRDAIGLAAVMLLVCAAAGQQSTA